MDWDGEERRTLTTEDIVAKAVRHTLIELGFDMTKPTEIQKDISHLRRSREICEMIQNQAVKCGIGLLITVILGGVWIGFKEAITDPNHIERSIK